MRDQSPENDPKSIWQNQPKEPSTMTLERIRQKAEELHAKTRVELLRGAAGPLLVAGIAGWTMAKIDSGPAVRALFTLALAWSLAGQYFVNRGMWSATSPGDATLRTGIESYRREVERRRYLSSHFLLWSLGPGVLALATLLVPLVGIAVRNGMLPRMIPFLTLLLTWIVAVFVVRLRSQRDLKREIDELNGIERMNTQP